MHPPIQIMFIQNGMLVTTAGTASQLNPQPQPVMKFCRDYVEVCQTIKALWPISIVE
jgi:hypothetical protein